MPTIVLTTQKGGSGKSTLAIGLALAALQAGHQVRVIETCSLGTLSNWQGRRAFAEPLVEPVYVAGDVERKLQALAHDDSTITIVDTASGTSAATTAAIRHADLCLIPTRPSIADIEATASTLSVIRAWKRPYAFVLNQAPIRGRRITDAANTLCSEAARDLQEVVAFPFVAMRNDHQDALANGLAVGEFAAGGKSAHEIRGLWRWIELKLGFATALQAPEMDCDMADVPPPVSLGEISETAIFG